MSAYHKKAEQSNKKSEQEFFLQYHCRIYKKLSKDDLQAFAQLLGSKP